MEIFDWASRLPASVTICDAEGKIIYMNDKSAETFSDYGGKEIIGRNLSEFHNDYSNAIIGHMLHEHTPNIYTIGKKEKKKLIYQAPVFNDNKFAGLVEISIELPDNMPHFKRD